MAAQPRHPSLHMTGQMRMARALRRDAITLSEDAYSMTQQICDRALRLGWADPIVQEGLRIQGDLLAKRDHKLAEARRYDALMQDIGA